LNKLILQKRIQGLAYSIPAYASLTLAYDPFVLSFEELEEQIWGLLGEAHQLDRVIAKRILKIPVCYETPFSLDKEEVLGQLGLNWEEIIRLHTQTKFRVYMLGFLPGFTYMGKLPLGLACKRKAKPRLRVPARSVGLAGLQTGIYPSEAPGGWQLIGKTPLEVFDPTHEKTFLLEAGDELFFEHIKMHQYEEIRSAIEHKIFDYQSLIQ
ncbi:MAG: 5-oxoprolinase subunit PxpB, partial [Bacteroidota bacterium]